MNRLTRMLFGITPLITLLGCADLESSDRLCSLMPELQSSAVALDQAFADLSRVDSAVLQSSIEVMVATVESIAEDAPSSIDPSLETIDRAFREVRQALRNVQFDGKIAVNDTAVLNAIDALKRSDYLAASRRLDSYVADECERSYEAPVPPQMGSGTTLPLPIQDSQAPEEYPFVLENESSALAAYGFMLLANRELTASTEQAICVGKVVTDLSQDQVDAGVIELDDLALEKFLDVAIRRCLAQDASSSQTATTEG